MKLRAYLIIGGALAALIVGWFALKPKPIPSPIVTQSIETHDSTALETTVTQDVKQRDQGKVKIKVTIPPHTVVGDSDLVVEIEGDVTREIETGQTDDTGIREIRHTDIGDETFYPDPIVDTPSQRKGLVGLQIGFSHNLARPFVQVDGTIRLTHGLHLFIGPEVDLHGIGSGHAGLRLDVWRGFGVIAQYSLDNRFMAGIAWRLE